MSPVIKRSSSQAGKSGPSRHSRPNSSLPQFIPPQLTQPVEKPPSGPQWVHEIKLDGFRMAARIDNGRVQLLTRTGLDWTGRYPSAVAALEKVNVKTAYIDGELCGVDEAGLPSFARTQAATDGERGVHVVYYSSISCISAGGTSQISNSSRARSSSSRWSQISPAFSSTGMTLETAS
jgi:bifunctional non-homologous end joining protein LigD